MRGVSEEATDLILRHAYSRATNKSYDSHWKRFVFHNPNYTTITVPNILNYATEHLLRYKASTISTALSAISSTIGITCSRNISNDPLLSAFHSGSATRRSDEPRSADKALL